MTDNVTLSKNETESRYELHVGDELVGLIDYRLRDGVSTMFHTEVDPAHGGKGYGQRIVEFALTDARDNGERVKPTCPFIAKYIARHPEFEEIRA